MNLANKITVVRLCLIPIYIVLLMQPQDGTAVIMLSAAGVFVLASLTDALDGYIARRYKFITNFGKFFDTLADKLLTCSAFIALVGLGRFPAWAAIAVIARELAILGLRAIAADKGVIISADKFGKIKTAAQMLAITYLTILPLIYFYPFTAAAANILTWAVVILTVASGLDYLARNRSLFTDF